MQSSSGSQYLHTVTIPTDADGKWRTSPLSLSSPPNATNVRYVISAHQRIDGYTYNAVSVTVFPQSPSNAIQQAGGGINSGAPVESDEVAVSPNTQNRKVHITSPKANATVTSPLIVRGTANANQEVEVRVKEQLISGSRDFVLYTVNADASGAWQTPSIYLSAFQAGKNLKYTISANQKIDGFTYNAESITVFPESPFSATKIPIPIDPNQIQDRAPQITSPVANNVVESPLTVEGVALKNNPVTIDVKALFDGGKLDLGRYSTTANADGKWKSQKIGLSFPAFNDAKNVKYEITASQEALGKNHSKTITVLPYQVLMATPLEPVVAPPTVAKIAPPTITFPTNGSIIKTPVLIEGKGTPGNVVRLNISATFESSLVIAGQELPGKIIDTVTGAIGGKKKVQQRDFEPVLAQVKSNGTWGHSAYIHPGKGADKIKYTISAIQVTPRDQKSESVTINVEHK